MCRGACHSKTPAFYGRQPLADGIDLHDIGTASQQLLCDILQFIQRDQRLFQQGASPAGQKKHHRILRRQPLNKVKRRLRTPARAVIRDRVSALKAADMGNRSFYMPILCNNHAIRNTIPQTVRCRVCHLPCRFSCCHQNDFSGSKAIPLQRTHYGNIRQNRVNCRRNDRFRMLMK